MCHLILCLSHHNLPYYVQRKAHWRPSEQNHRLGHHTEIYLWPILTIHNAFGLWINSHRLEAGEVQMKSVVEIDGRLEKYSLTYLEYIFLIIMT